MVVKLLGFYQIVPIQWMGHTSTGRGVNVADLFECATSLDTVVSRCCLARVPGRPSICVTQSRLIPLGSQRAILQTLTLLGAARFISWWKRLTYSSTLKEAGTTQTLQCEARFITWRLWHPYLRECWQSPRHLREFRACKGYIPAPRPTFKKTVWHTRLLGGTRDKYR